MNPKDIRDDCVDAQTMHQRYPDTFEVPEPDELAAIAPGDYVKICTGQERFWVRVHDHTSPLLTGVVRNDLLYTDEHHLVCDDPVLFEERNIYSILPSS